MTSRKRKEKIVEAPEEQDIMEKGEAMHGEVVETVPVDPAKMTIVEKWAHIGRAIMAGATIDEALSVFGWDTSFVPRAKIVRGTGVKKTYHEALAHRQIAVLARLTAGELPFKGGAVGKENQVFLALLKGMKGPELAEKLGWPDLKSVPVRAADNARVIFGDEALARLLRIPGFDPVTKKQVETFKYALDGVEWATHDFQAVADAELAQLQEAAE